MIGATSMLLMAATAVSVQHEKVDVPKHWIQHQRTNTDLSFVFALKHTKEQREWLYNTVQAVSIPGSPRYGKYLSLDALTAKLRIAQTDIDVVYKHLASAGFTQITTLPSGDFMRASASADVASKFFETEFCEWKHTSSSVSNVVRSCDLKYHLPSEVSVRVDFVSGLLHFPLVRQAKVGVSDPQASGDVEDIRRTSNAVGLKPTGRNSTVAFTQFIGQRYNDQDVDLFIQTYSPEQAGQKIVNKVGEVAEGHGVEALLDAEYLLAMGNGVATWVWTNQHKNPVNNQEPWVEFFTNVAGNRTVPLLFSISYGEDENTVTKDYADRSDAELQKVAARGITMLAASGDSGSNCVRSKFLPNFPAALPHITSVGATGRCTEGSAVAGFSSGGFSDMFDRPSWQDDAINEFFRTSNLPPDSYYNRHGRGFPDIASCGNVRICDRRCGLPVSGTSCSCPIFAGLMGIANDARLTQGKPSLGFLAPALYAAYKQDKTAFNDVTTGRTEGCNGHAWHAEAGWDPATGFGVPNMRKLISVLLSM